MNEKWERPSEITERIYGYSLSATTLQRWINGQNKQNRKLRTIKLGNRHLTTETLLRQYVEQDNTDEPNSTTVNLKTRSERARAKAIAAACADLEASGV